MIVATRIDVRLLARTGIALLALTGFAACTGDADSREPPTGVVSSMRSMPYAGDLAAGPAGLWMNLTTRAVEVDPRTGSTSSSFDVDLRPPTLLGTPAGSPTYLDESGAEAIGEISAGDPSALWVVGEAHGPVVRIDLATGETEYETQQAYQRPLVADGADVWVAVDQGRLARLSTSGPATPELVETGQVCDLALTADYVFALGRSGESSPKATDFVAEWSQAPPDQLLRIDRDTGEIDRIDLGENNAGVAACDIASDGTGAWVLVADFLHPGSQLMRLVGFDSSLRLLPTSAEVVVPDPMTVERNWIEATSAGVWTVERDSLTSGAERVVLRAAKQFDSTTWALAPDLGTSPSVAGLAVEADVAWLSGDDAERQGTAFLSTLSAQSHR
jgi:hypothetical protein